MSTEAPEVENPPADESMVFITQLMSASVGQTFDAMNAVERNLREDRDRYIRAFQGLWYAIDEANKTVDSMKIDRILENFYTKIEHSRIVLNPGIS